MASTGEATVASASHIVPWFTPVTNKSRIKHLKLVSYMSDSALPYGIIPLCLSFISKWLISIIVWLLFVKADDVYNFISWHLFVWSIVCNANNILQYIPRNIHTVFAVLCCGYTLTDFPISIRLTSLALWQSNDCPSANKATLMNVDKYFMWIHYERLHNHNKAKHNKTVCTFLGIYCRWCLPDSRVY